MTDPQTEQEVPLFNPRADRWNDHFAWDEDWQIVGLTAIGCATIDVLNSITRERLRIREAEE